MYPLNSMNPIWKKPLHLFMLLGIWLSSANAAFAAEQINIRYGFLEQSVAVRELERFISTGEIPIELRPYEFMLTPELRQSLRQGLQLNPDISPQALEQMWQSPMGKRLLKVLGKVIPNTNSQELLTTISRASELPQGLNLINFFRAFPTATLTIDAGSVLAVKSQLESYYLKSKTLSPALERDLFVSNSPPLPANLDPAAPGNEKVRIKNLTLQDRWRNRSLALKIYTPAQPQGPLMVMLHGLGGNQNALAYLARHLASYGFTVVTLHHPDQTALERSSDEFTLGGELYLPTQEFLERPRDITFMLDQLTHLNRQPGPWQGQFNTQQVTVIGQSLGGTTALTLAGAEFDLERLRTTCRAIDPIGQSLSDWALCNATVLPGRHYRLSDPRVSQAILINPVVGKLFGEQGLAQVKVPTLMISSTADSISPAILNHLEPFTWLGGTKYLVTAIGATHLSANDLDNVIGNKRFRVVSERLGEENKTLQQLVRGVSLAFVQQLTPEAQRYQPFLTSSYAQALSLPTLPLRLTTKLPETLVQRLDQVLQTSQIPAVQPPYPISSPLSRRSVPTSQ